MDTNTISVQQHYVKLVWVQIKMLNRHDILIINRLITIDSFSIDGMRLLVYYIVICFVKHNYTLHVLFI